MNSKTGIYYYIKSYKLNSLFIKNFLLIMLLIFMPLAGLSIAVYNYFNEIIREEMGAADFNAISRVRDMVDMISNETDRLSVRIASDPDVEELLSSHISEYPDYDTIERFQNVNKVLGVSTITSDYIDSIYIYSEKNDYILTSKRGSGLLWQFFDTGWVDEYNQKKMELKYWTSYRGFKNKFYSSESFSFITNFRMTPIYDKRKLGFVAINIDINKLGGLINNVSNTRSEDIYIVDEEGSVLYNANPALINSNIFELGWFSGMSLSAGSYSYIKEIGGIKKVVSLVKSNYNSWKFISIVPLSQLEKKTGYLREFMITAIAVSIIILIGVAFIISIRVFMPIKNIISTIQNPGQWINIGQTDSSSNLNELKYITNTIIKSFNEGRKMEEELEHRLALLKKAQAIALQSQINPHFLYNTLETINWMAMKLTKSENEVTAIVTSLSQLLRISLSTGDTLIPVSTEIEHAMRYVDIQKVRYRDKFDEVWEIDDGILDCKTVKIVLQPLIENAIYHGIKPKYGKGDNMDRGYFEADCIVLEVSDDGVGMAGETLHAIYSGLNGNGIKEDKHIGLPNVDQRVKIVFGEEYGIRMDSEVNKGTRVKVVTPIVKISDHSFENIQDLRGT